MIEKIKVEHSDGYSHQYQPISLWSGMILVCSESMFEGKVIDWAAYKGYGSTCNPGDILQVALFGDKVSESMARKAFPDQTGKWRD